ncbi:type IV pilus modification protein PilV [Acinetobacter ursingii]|uniref:type IV pilus modification protein PilV n=1 Tax=Acinetobacter ursingii TaxID=108980 RepID=UPI00244699EA|nr:type IV pilus modification protein PilV [Acinetobacter ursingii]MDG9860859.1 type IV pilus modification protein PilV [Acinetobacter ursingii]MDG9894540.1 type IV pilus modification protein PilV [Acinetobacter ursingii]MDH0008025.1 type IV pilus modification protein PilV [Acinetobacter ursingii]MDH0479761.1 type IV pilus modification protein PilV [Acinetobacter ursingii]MDH2104177.1 type IV pilus modification protein PilV [Acinetobacter ursingii]
MILNTFNQRGVGLVEVLVALLLLSIGVLGFAVLQIRALDASIEASKRIQATTIARDIAERIRANQQGLTKDIETEDKDGKKALYKAYVQAFSGKDSISSYTYQKCFNSSAGCSSEIFAQEDANQVLYKAYQMGMKVGLSECNSSTALQRTRYCIYIAWDETNPKDGSDSKDCTNDGSYRFDSKCILMEIY